MHIASAKLKQEAMSALGSLIGFATLVLVTLGVGGTIYKAIAPDGWIARAFGQSISAGAAVLGSLGVVLALAWFSTVVRSPRRRNRHAGLFVYVFGAAGFAYAVQLVMKGTF